MALTIAGTKTRKKGMQDTGGCGRDSERRYSPEIGSERGTACSPRRHISDHLGSGSFRLGLARVMLEALPLIPYLVNNCAVVVEHTRARTTENPSPLSALLCSSWNIALWNLDSTRNVRLTYGRGLFFPTDTSYTQIYKRLLCSLSLSVSLSAFFEF